MENTLIYIFLTIFFLVILLCFLSFVPIQKTNHAENEPSFENVMTSYQGDFNSTETLLKHIQIQQAKQIHARLAYLESAADKAMHLYSALTFTCGFLAFTLALLGLILALK